MILNTLVVDCGQHCVGILSIADGDFRVYYIGPEMAGALRRIQLANEVVTYNGKHHDLKVLGKFGNSDVPFPLLGTHSDMRSIIWSDDIWGSGLESTYLMHFRELPEVPATYEGINIQRDVLMTYDLWKLWKADQIPGAA